MASKINLGFLNRFSLQRRKFDHKSYSNLHLVLMLKHFFGGNLDFPKIKKFTKVCSNAWTCTKCENNAIFKQKYTRKLFISFKYPILAVFALGEI